jgi:hypothetical protein
MEKFGFCVSLKIVINTLLRDCTRFRVINRALKSALGSVSDTFLFLHLLVVIYISLFISRAAAMMGLEEEREVLRVLVV